MVIFLLSTLLPSLSSVTEVDLGKNYLEYVFRSNSAFLPTEIILMVLV